MTEGMSDKLTSWLEDHKHKGGQAELSEKLEKLEGIAEERGIKIDRMQAEINLLRQQLTDHVSRQESHHQELKRSIADQLANKHDTVSGEVKFKSAKESLYSDVGMV